MFCRDRQILRFRETYARTGNLRKSAMMAGISDKTGRTYRANDKLPSEIMKSQERHWKTRKDPFEEDWPEIKQMLEDAPELEAKTIFDKFNEDFPDKYQEGQLRTLQRKIRIWRASEGPPKEVFFPQVHKPGEFMQTDWTDGGKLGITINGEPYDHWLCNSVLPYSNWQSVAVCRSESEMSLQKGFQKAVFKLGKKTLKHKTDNSTAVTHYDKKLKCRPFNDGYIELMKHFGVKPCLIGIGKKEQNGDVEALNNSLKRRLRQYLLLRGSKDFGSVKEYEDWLDSVVDKANRQRTKRLNEELNVMRPLTAKRISDYRTSRVKVSSWSTVRINANSYSVPTRLIGEWVSVRNYEDRIEVYYSGKLQLRTRRLTGNNGATIDYRHVIWSLVDKPGAFERYRYREEMFPSLVFRKTYDKLLTELNSQYHADRRYLRILHLAASHMEEEVQAGLELCFESEITPSVHVLKGLIGIESPKHPEVQEFEPNLQDYDSLIVGN